jgi:hypothetical protein
MSNSKDNQRMMIMVAKMKKMGVPQSTIKIAMSGGFTTGGGYSRSKQGKMVNTMMFYPVANACSDPPGSCPPLW